MFYGSWFMVYGLWFMVEGLGVRIYGLWCRVQGLGIRVLGAGFSLGLRVCAHGLEFRFPLGGARGGFPHGNPRGT